MRLGGYEGRARGEGFLDLEVGGLALADIAGVDAVGDLVAGFRLEASETTVLLRATSSARAMATLIGSAGRMARLFEAWVAAMATDS